MTKVTAHFFNIREALLKVLDNCQESLVVCMAWFTDEVLMEKLLELLDAGVNVELCLFDDESNKKKDVSNVPNRLENLKRYKVGLQMFQEKNGILNTIHQDIEYLHHKFAIIDGKLTITGSYNWTIAAMYHKENIVIIEDEQIAKQFLAHYKDIVSNNHQNIIDHYLKNCPEEFCPGKIFKAKVLDFRNTSQYHQNDTYTLEFCTVGKVEHARIVLNSDSDSVGDVLENEYSVLEDELQGRDFKNKNAVIRRRIESKLARELDSRLDVFLDGSSHHFLGLYKITVDIDGDWQFEAIWEHDLIKPFYIEEWGDDIIDMIDNL